MEIIFPVLFGLAFLFLIINSIEKNEERERREKKERELKSMQKSYDLELLKNKSREKTEALIEEIKTKFKFNYEVKIGKRYFTKTEASLSSPSVKFHNTSLRLKKDYKDITIDIQENREGIGSIRIVVNNGFLYSNHYYGDSINVSNNLEKSNKVILNEIETMVEKVFLNLKNLKL